MPRHAPICLLLLLAACGGGTTGSPTGVALDPCLVSRAGPGAPSRVRVVFSESVNPLHAPRPVNDAEAFLFTQLYAGLTALGCTGHPRPLVATRWEPASGQARWSVSLDAPWSALQAHTAPWPPGAVRWPATSGTVGLAGAEVLALEFTEPVPELPLLLSDPALALVGDSAGPGGGPAATGAYRIASATGSSWRLEAAAPGRPVLEVQARVPAGSAALPESADMTITRDPAGVAAARADPRLAIIPLAWDRTWVLGSAPGAPTAALATQRTQLLEVLRGDFRAAEGDGGRWLERATCIRPAEAPRRGDHIGYVPGDSVGQRLAARIVALAQQRGLLIKTVPWDPAASPAPAAVVLPASRAPLATCAGVHALPSGWIATPLVDGRATAVLRVGAVSLVQDGRGSVRVVAGDPDSGS